MKGKINVNATCTNLFDYDKIEHDWDNCHDCIDILSSSQKNCIKATKKRVKGTNIKTLGIDLARWVVAKL